MELAGQGLLAPMPDPAPWDDVAVGTPTTPVRVISPEGWATPQAAEAGAQARTKTTEAASRFASMTVLLLGVQCFREDNFKDRPVFRGSKSPKFFDGGLATSPIRP